MSDIPLSEIRVLGFKRAYFTSAGLTAFFILPGAIGGMVSAEASIMFSIGMLLAVAMIILPAAWRGGVLKNLKWAIVTAAVAATAFTVMIAGAFVEFVETGGAEGPRGEGSPLAIIFAMCLGVTLFQGPWLLTALRGVRLWRRRSEVEKLK